MLAHFKLAPPLQGGNQGVMAIYATPSGPGRCRFLFSFMEPKSALPLQLRATFALYPKWLKHLEFTARVIDGDSAILHGQVGSPGCFGHTSH
jgi:hypothetical protein